MTRVSASTKTYNTPNKPIVGHVLITVSADGVIDVTAGGVLHNQLRHVIKALQQ